MEWFDKKTGYFRLDEIVAKKKTFKKIMADKVVTDKEICDQSKHLLKCLMELDKALDQKQKKLVTEALSEMAVLYAVTHARSEKEEAR